MIIRLLVQFLLSMFLQSAVHASTDVPCDRSTVNLAPCTDKTCPIFTDDGLSCPERGELMDNDGYPVHSDDQKCDKSTGRFPNKLIVVKIHCKFPCGQWSVTMKPCDATTSCPTFTAEGITCPVGRDLMNTNGVVISDVSCDSTTGLYKNVEGEIHCGIECAGWSDMHSWSTDKSVSVERCVHDESCRPIITNQGISCPPGGTLKDTTGTIKGPTTCETTTGRYKGCDNCVVYCDGLYSPKELHEMSERELQQQKDDYNKDVIMGVGVGGAFLLLVAIVLDAFGCLWYCRLKKKKKIAAKEKGMKPKRKEETTKIKMEKVVPPPVVVPNSSNVKTEPTQDNNTVPSDTIQVEPDETLSGPAAPANSPVVQPPASPGYQAAPGYQSAPGYQYQNVYTMSPGYASQPGYMVHPSYQYPRSPYRPQFDFGF